MAEHMNPILQNIYEQPAELRRVLDDLTGPHFDDLRRLAHMLGLAKEVVLTSMGSALYSLMPMYEAMVAQGMRNVRLVETAELLHHPERVHHDALYLMMSRSGESREVADFARWTKAHTYMCACITMTPDSTMATHSSYVLHDVASYDKIVCIKAYSSMALCGLMIVHMLYRERPDEELLARLYAAFDWMERNKEDVLSQIEAIDFLPKADSFYMISRDEGVNMMRSASLWLEETAKVPANVMSADNLYHGPMELLRAQGITKSHTVPVLLDVFPDDRSKMIWGYINDATSDTIYVGHDAKARAGAQLLLPELGLTGPEMMLVEALWFQLLSYQVAIVNNIEPGMFFEDGWVVK